MCVRVHIVGQKRCELKLIFPHIVLESGENQGMHLSLSPLSSAFLCRCSWKTLADTGSGTEEVGESDLGTTDVKYLVCGISDTKDDMQPRGRAFIARTLAINAIG